MTGTLQMLTLIQLPIVPLNLISQYLYPQLVSEGHERDSYYNVSYLHETLSVISPIEQYINKVVYVPLNTSFTGWFDHHYIQIATTNTTEVLLDDKPYHWDWGTYSWL